MNREVTPDMIDYPFTEYWDKGFKWHAAPELLVEDKPKKTYSWELNKPRHLSYAQWDEINRLKGEVIYLHDKLNRILDKKKDNIWGGEG